MSHREVAVSGGFVLPLVHHPQAEVLFSGATGDVCEEGSWACLKAVVSEVSRTYVGDAVSPKSASMASDASPISRRDLTLVTFMASYSMSELLGSYGSKCRGWACYFPSFSTGKG